MNKIPKEYKWIAGFMSIFITIVVISIVSYYSPENVTKREINSIVVEEMKNKNIENKKRSNSLNYISDRVISELAQKDGWDNNYMLTYTENKTLKKYLVTSSGEDSKFFTSDDITAEKTDYNKSRIIGKFVTDKLSEAVGGVKDSLSERFNKPKDPDREGLLKKAGKKIGSVIKSFKEGGKKEEE